MKAQATQVDVRPKVGFAGVGWIGRSRMESLVESGTIDAGAVADPDPERVEKAGAVAPGAERHEGLEALLEEDLDGIVIATPSALHADQTMRALEAGLSVFCQKPLGRDVRETRQVVETARRANRLLGVDLSYRHTEGMQRVRSLIQEEAIGDVYAIELVFHNAYGPDKDWFYDPKQSGGGCVMDLGIHLVDLLLWTMDFPDVERVTSRLFTGGQPLDRPDEQVEDYATARIDLQGGAAASLACSWNLPAGRDAVIEVTFYGTEGGLSFSNVDGSFYDFKVDWMRGTTTETLVSPPDDWGGRAAVDWARRLIRSNRYDDEIESAICIARVLDAIYRR